MRDIAKYEAEGGMDRCEKTWFFMMVTDSMLEHYRLVKERIQDVMDEGGFVTCNDPYARFLRDLGLPVNCLTKEKLMNRLSPQNYCDTKGLIMRYFTEILDENSMPVSLSTYYNNRIKGVKAKNLTPVKYYWDCSEAPLPPDDFYRNCAEKDGLKEPIVVSLKRASQYEYLAYRLKKLFGSAVDVDGHSKGMNVTVVIGQKNSEAYRVAKKFFSYVFLALTAKFGKGEENAPPVYHVKTLEHVKGLKEVLESPYGGSVAAIEQWMIMKEREEEKAAAAQQGGVTRIDGGYASFNFPLINRGVGPQPEDNRFSGGWWNGGVCYPSPEAYAASHGEPMATVPRRR